MQPRSEKKKVPGSSVLLSPPIVQSGLFMSIIMCLIPFTTKRREDITMNPYDLCTLFEKYPFLNDTNQVINSTYM